MYTHVASTHFSTTVQGVVVVAHVTSTHKEHWRICQVTWIGIIQLGKPTLTDGMAWFHQCGVCLRDRLPPPTSPFLSPRTCMYTNLSYFRDEGVLSGLHLIQQLLSLALHLFETSLIVRLYLPGCLGGWTMRVTMVTSQHHIQVPIAPTYNDGERVAMVTNWHHQVPLR